MGEIFLLLHAGAFTNCTLEGPDGKGRSETMKNWCAGVKAARRKQHKGRNSHLLSRLCAGH